MVAREEGNPCTVLTASPFDCRWVTNQTTVEGLRIFCGEPTSGTRRPWCADHLKLIYIKTDKKEDLVDKDDD